MKYEYFISSSNKITSLVDEGNILDTLDFSKVKSHATFL